MKLTIYKSSINSYWNDPLTNWMILTAKDKKQFKYESIFALTISFQHRSYGKEKTY